MCKVDISNQEVLGLSSYLLVNDQLTELTRTKGFAAFVKKLCPQYVITDQTSGELYCEYCARVDFAITKMNNSVGFFYADLIKIADRSDLGWVVVSEYTADELADDSDDEKCLEKEAEKMASRRKKNSESRQRSYKRPTNLRLVSDALPGQSVVQHPSVLSLEAR